MSLEFNWEVYKLLNCDLERQLKEPAEFKRHFMFYGKCQNRKYNIVQVLPDFDWNRYKKNNPDLDFPKQIDYEKHYLQRGINECRLYGDLEKYLEFEKNGFLNEKKNFNWIDKYIYINLEKRIDRRYFFLRECERLGVPAKKLCRFDAICNLEMGAIGCMYSHIGALELALKNKWNKVIIFEDDVQFIDNTMKIYSILSKIENLKDYDVIQFHYFKIGKDAVYSFSNLLDKANYCTMGTAYLIKLDFIPKLLENMKEGVKLLEETREKSYTLDHYWSKLQKESKWFILREKILAQRHSFSDNEKIVVDYNKFQQK